MKPLPARSTAFLQAVDLRRVAYVALLASAAVCGAVASAAPAVGMSAFGLLLPAYVAWIVGDLRVRAVTGAAFWWQLLVALIPAWGLLGYLFFTRRAMGLLVWVAMVMSLWVPAGLGALLGRGAFCTLAGERW